MYKNTQIQNVRLKKIEVVLVLPGVQLFPMSTCALNKEN